MARAAFGCALAREGLAAIAAEPPGGPDASRVGMTRCRRAMLR
jgi:hypothetical protein